MGFHLAFGVAERTLKGFDLFGGGFAGLRFFQFGAAHGQLDFRAFQLSVFCRCGRNFRGRHRGRWCIVFQLSQGTLGSFELLLQDD